VGESEKVMPVAARASCKWPYNETQYPKEFTKGLKKGEIRRRGPKERGLRPDFAL